MLHLSAKFLIISVRYTRKHSIGHYLGGERPGVILQCSLLQSFDLQLSPQYNTVYTNRYSGESEKTFCESFTFYAR